MQLTVELLVAHKYGLAVAFITPLVLTLVHIGVPARSGPSLIGERLAETGIGIAIALAVGLALFRRTGSRRLPAAVAATADAAVRAAERPRGRPGAARRAGRAVGGRDGGPGGAADDRRDDRVAAARTLGRRPRAGHCSGPGPERTTTWWES